MNLNRSAIALEESFVEPRVGANHLQGTLPNVPVRVRRSRLALPDRHALPPALTAPEPAARSHPLLLLLFRVPLPQLVDEGRNVRSIEKAAIVKFLDGIHEATGGEAGVRTSLLQLPEEPQKGDDELVDRHLALASAEDRTGNIGPRRFD